MSHNDFVTLPAREKYFGWFPKETAPKLFILGNLIYVGYCMYGWPNLEPRYLFGWWPIYDFVAKAVIGTWAAVMWGLYYYCFWPKLKDGVEE